jgi:exodeoxyribonuclease VII large subunit
LHDSVHTCLDATTNRLAALESHLKHLNPQHVLERGYSITMLGDTIVRDAEQLRAHDEVKVVFARGSADARVKRTDS